MHRSVENADVGDALGNVEIFRAVVARGLLQLLQSSVRLDSVQGVSVLPETLSFDAER